MISVLDWVYPISNKAKAYSVREVIGDKLALTAPDYTRLYLGMSEDFEGLPVIKYEKQEGYDKST